MHVLILTLSKPLVSSLKWCWIGGNMWKLAKSKGFFHDFCVFCQVFSRRVEAQGSSEFHQCVVTPSFHVLSLIANQDIAKALVVHKSFRWWIFDSVLIREMGCWVSSYLTTKSSAKEIRKMYRSKPWNPSFIVADKCLEPRFELPLLLRRGSLEKRQVRRFKKGGF